MTTGDNGRDDREKDRNTESNMYTYVNIIYTKIKTIEHKNVIKTLSLGQGHHCPSAF